MPNGTEKRELWFNIRDERFRNSDPEVRKEVILEIEEYLRREGFTFEELLDECKRAMDQLEQPDLIYDDEYFLVPIMSLGLLGDKRAVKYLNQLFQDHSGGIKIQAAVALFLLGAKDVPEIIKLYKEIYHPLKWDVDTDEFAFNMAVLGDKAREPMESMLKYLLETMIEETTKGWIDNVEVMYVFPVYSKTYNIGLPVEPFKKIFEVYYKEKSGGFWHLNQMVEWLAEIDDINLIGKILEYTIQKQDDEAIWVFMDYLNKHYHSNIPKLMDYSIENLDDDVTVWLLIYLEDRKVDDFEEKLEAILEKRIEKLAKIVKTSTKNEGEKLLDIMRKEWDLYNWYGKLPLINQSYIYYESRLDLICSIIKKVGYRGNERILFTILQYVNYEDREKGSFNEDFTEALGNLGGRIAVDILVNTLKYRRLHIDPYYYIADSLIKIGSKRAIRPLIEFIKLKKNEPGAYLGIKPAVKVLSELGDRSIIPVIEELLETEQYSSSYNKPIILEAIEKLKKKSAKHSVLYQLDDEVEYLTRIDDIKTIGEMLEYTIQKQDSKTIRAFMDYIVCNYDIIKLLDYSLEYLEDDVLYWILRYLTDVKVEYNFAFVAALGQVGGREAVTILVNMIKHGRLKTNDDSCYHVADSLIKINCKKTIKPLVKFIRMKKMKTSPNFGIISAVIVLSELGNKRTIPILEKLLKKEHYASYYIREAIQDAIEKLKHKYLRVRKIRKKINYRFS